MAQDQMYPHITVVVDAAYVDHRVEVKKIWEVYALHGNMASVYSKFPELSREAIHSALAFILANQRFMPKTPDVEEKPCVHYFGVWDANTPGHRMVGPSPGLMRTFFISRKIDGGFCPDDPRQQEGVAKLTEVRINDRVFTVLAFWDRSVDARPGSHSTFIVEGKQDFVSAVRWISEAFPSVWNRFTFPISLYGSND